MLGFPGTLLQAARNRKLITSADSSFHVQITCASKVLTEVKLKPATLTSTAPHPILWHIPWQVCFHSQTVWPTKLSMVGPIWAALLLCTLPHITGLESINWLAIFHSVAAGYHGLLLRLELSYPMSVSLVGFSADILDIVSLNYCTHCQQKSSCHKALAPCVYWLFRENIVYILSSLQVDLIRGGPSFQTYSQPSGDRRAKCFSSWGTWIVLRAFSVCQLITFHPIESQKWLYRTKLKIRWVYVCFPPVHSHLTGLSGFTMFTGSSLVHLFHI